jgi:phosphoribosylaminoimidazolecarboxamide formyltransferase/IMP cyclohydrolase
MKVMNGKALSYNNIADLDAGLNLLSNFEQPTFCILKHSNPCGLASGITIMEAWEKALACDPSSAFGGILLTNGLVTAQLAEKINDIFYEILAAPGFEPEALEVLKSKKNRILIQIEHYPEKNLELKSALNGFLIQEPDRNFSAPETWEVKTGKVSESQHADLIFAEKAVRHLKSNAIALVRNQQLIGAGIGQTSRIQALEQAIAKARHMGFDIQNAVLASDAFFPFSDCAQIAKEAGISLILQPGGSIRDEESIEYCRKNNMTLIFTGIRHFWH